MGYFYDSLLSLGYREAGRPEDRQFYGAGGFADAGWRPWSQLREWAKARRPMRRIDGECDRAPVVESARQVIESMVRCAEHDGWADVNWMAMGKYGFAGMEAYAADIADLSKPTDDFDAGWLGCHCADRQLAGRKCAAIYLKRVAEAFEQPARDHVLAAAEQYEQAYAAWNEWERLLGNGGPKDAWKVGDNRVAGAAAIRKAIERERAAHAELQQVIPAQ